MVNLLGRWILVETDHDQHEKTDEGKVFRGMGRPVWMERNLVAKTHRSRFDEEGEWMANLVESPSETKDCAVLVVVVMVKLVFVSPAPPRQECAVVMR